MSCLRGGLWSVWFRAVFIRLGGFSGKGWIFAVKGCPVFFIVK